MYLNYYQLTQKPFQIDTNPAFLWLGEKQKEALANLKYGLSESNGFLVLTGDIGVGKTTIINALIQMLGPNDQAAVIRDPLLEKMDFFNYMAAAFGAHRSYASKGDFLKSFHRFLRKRHYQGRRVLLIIDEAQLLTRELLEEMRLLSNLERNGIKLLRVFFIGQTEFNEILLRPENKAIKQRITVNYKIEPLTEKETGKYIEFRMAVAGARKIFFHKASVHEMYRFSKGYPRLINVIADRALLTGFIQSARYIKKDVIRECARELDISEAIGPQEKSHEEEGDARKPTFFGKGRRLGCVLYPALVLLIVLMLYMFIDRLLPLFAIDIF